ncbi:sensor domain-containing diguanylate cyclase [Kangiella shandongensis]|uniref:sensor domain-containing diguanylate cyclase n=1 Tax=Kangiella shandongensis TaxID=2763258 RepID=UPI001CBF55FD|nr:diguanylate cyclase [Kangiella shandongensis]
MSIHLGQIFVVICLITRGSWPAIITAIFAAVGLYSSTQSFPLVLLSLLESIALVLLYRKGVLLILADVIFWLLIGIPVVLMSIVVFFDISSREFMQVILIKQALTGILNVSLASMIRPFIPLRWYALKHQAVLPRLSSRIFELALISIALPSVIITFILSDNTADRFEQQLTKQLDIRAKHLTELAQEHTRYHQKAIQNLAEVFSHKDTTDKFKQEMLNVWGKQYPGLLTMIVTDEHGIVTQGTPYANFEELLKQPIEKRDVSDRDYFKQTRQSLQAYVSGVFKGRGFGADPIIAVSAPIVIEGQFRGIVEGSLNLPDFERIDHLGDETSVLVLDESNHVIYASEELQLRALDRLELAETGQPYTNSLKAVELKNGAYNYKRVSTDDGWRIFVLTPFDGLIESYKKDFYGLIIILLIISGIALEVTRRIALQVTRPLERMVNYFALHRPVPRKPASYFSSQEIESVRQQLLESQQLMLEFQDELQQQVDDKTRELVLLNQKLEKLSTHDPLTGILNRRGFEQVVDKVYQLACRNKTPMTLAIMDLDHFKAVNDGYGHSAGDRCLIRVGKVLGDVFKRDTDFVARFGGEEFIVLIVGTDVANHLQLLEKLRQNIESMTVEHGEEHIQFTISIGAYSQVEQFNLDYHQMVSKADKLLYESKRLGRNRITTDKQ